MFGGQPCPRMASSAQLVCDGLDIPGTHVAVATLQAPALTWQPRPQSLEPNIQEWMTRYHWSDSE